MWTHIEAVLNEREALILQCVVHMYINTAVPVGSRSVVKRYGLDVSPATVRNVMADLEDAGYLEQVHTSSGRVPTDKGYRYYVNYLMQVPELSEGERGRIDRQLQVIIGDTDTVVRHAGQILATVSRQTGLIEIPNEGAAEIRHIEIVPVGATRLAVLIADTLGRVRTSVIMTDQAFTIGEIAPVNQFLGEFGGRSFEQVIEAIESVLHGLWDERKLLAERALSWLQRVPASRDATVFLQGTTLLFEQPEFRDLAKARELLALIEERSRLAALLQALLTETKGRRLAVVIGSEFRADGFDEISVVASPYCIGEHILGVVGVLGPRRMSYSRMSAIVDYTAESLSRHLTRLAV